MASRMVLQLAASCAAIVTAYLLLPVTYFPTLFLHGPWSWTQHPERPPHPLKKSVPLQAWNGPEGSRKLRLPDFMTTAQVGGKVVSLTHRPPLPPGNAPGIHVC